MKKIFKFLHLWLAIPTGLIITIVCLTGAILVFQQEILEWSNPSHYFVENTGKDAIPLDELIPMVNKQLTDNTVAGVQIPADPQRTYTMTLKEGFRVSAFVNPYSGEVTGYYYFQKSPFYTVMVIHRWLLDGTRTWGKYAVGISTLLFVVILITGIFIQLPVRFNRKTFSISFKRGKQRLLWDLHNVLGLYSLILLIILSLTGLMWSFEWYRNGVFKLFGAEVTASGGGHGRGGERGKEKDKVLDISQWNNIAGALIDKNPDYEYVRIQEGTANVHLKSSPTSRATDQYIFDNATGVVKKTVLYKDSPATSRIWGWAYALHVGNFWGIWSKILVFVASLIGASLPVTGYWLYFRKLARKRRKKSSSPQ